MADHGDQHRHGDVIELAHADARHDEILEKVDAGAHFSWLAGFLGVDSPASSALTRELLGWKPTNVRLVEDLEQGHYFRIPAE